MAGRVAAAFGCGVAAMAAVSYVQRTRADKRETEITKSTETNVGSSSNSRGRNQRPTRGTEEQEELFRGLETHCMPYSVYDIRSVESCEAVIKGIGLGSGPGVIGLDLEWTQKNPPALLQIATDRDVLLIQLHTMAVRQAAVRAVEMGEGQFSGANPPLVELPPALRAVLENPQILKTGVGIGQDAKRLTIFGVHTQGLVDLQHLAKHCGVTDTSLGLKALSNKVLGVPMVDKHPVRWGNWEAPTLTRRQRTYAVADAVISRELFEHFRCVNGGGMEANEWIESIRPALQAKVKPPRLAKSPKSDQTGVKGRQQSVSVARMPTRQKPLYDNCTLVSPNGEPMCNCGLKKIKWYVDRGLAEVVQEEPTLIARLKFEPRGLGRNGDPYYMSPKPNRCVVCGCEAMKNLVKFHVVPLEYRRCFPLELKSHKSHDIVLLCVSCGGRAAQAYGQERMRIAAQMDAPSGGLGDKWIRDNDLMRIVNAANALLTQTEDALSTSALYKATEEGSSSPQNGSQRKKKPELPERRIEELFTILVDRINSGKGFPCPQNDSESRTADDDEDTQNGESAGTTAGAIDTEVKTFELSLPLTREDLKRVSKMPLRVWNPAHRPHAELVVTQLGSMHLLNDFVKRWRSLFLRALQPKFLPEHWNVDFSEEIFEVQNPANRKRGITLQEWTAPDAPVARPPRVMDPELFPNVPGEEVHADDEANEGQ